MKSVSSHDLQDAPGQEGASPQLNAIFHALRRDILLRRLQPRERLTEEELSVRFDAGRYLIRAALNELARIGLVVRRPNRGVVVADYDPKDIEQLYELRGIMQIAAIERMKMPGSPELVAELRDINERYRDGLEDGDLELIADLNASFHRTLFEACSNPYIVDAIERLWQKTAIVHGYSIGVPALARRSYDEHAAMIESLEKGDRARLVDLCLAHMQPALDAMRAQYTNLS